MRSWSYFSIHSKCIEPRKRMVGGVWGWASHKYPIKGGISHRLAMIADLYEPRNGMLQLLGLEHLDTPSQPLRLNSGSDSP